jgi:2-keto-4-pentenoate hydratase/2-oxohepta-3-ene-1,7-dioic acid hydratase in catechol pathway
MLWGYTNFPTERLFSPLELVLRETTIMNLPLLMKKDRIEPDMKNRFREKTIQLLKTLCQFLVIPAVIMNIAGCGSDPVPFSGHDFQPGQEKEGHWQQLSVDKITDIYGVGLSYAQHIEETASSWAPDQPPPVFRKALSALNRGTNIPYPSHQDFLAMAEEVEPGLAAKLSNQFDEIDILLDYEVELAIVLLEPFNRKLALDAAYMPKIGFVLAGDFTSRSFMVLGEDQPDPMLYWGAAKSFPGFAAVGSRMWVPDAFPADGLLEVVLETRVNDVLQQKGDTDNRVYSARQMLTYVADAYPDASLGTGTVIMTGTPPGVAFQVPAWKRTLADIFKLSRFTKLETVMASQRNNPAFLKKGDIVSHTAGPLGGMVFAIE